jgi:RNA polymerase sigma-70 factor (ECF subfamily)
MDKHEFENLILLHLDEVYRLAYQLAGCPEDAADLVHETCWKALNDAEKLDVPDDDIRPWLLNILNSVFHAHATRSERAPIPAAELELDEGSGDDTVLGEGTLTWNLACLGRKQFQKQLSRAIERLRPEDRGLLLLWGLEGLTYRQIAAVLDLPIERVTRRLRRAIRHLDVQLVSCAKTSPGVPAGSAVEPARTTKRATAQVLAGAV